ncbi:hypothetical protein [Alteromonas macleodii]|jgi:hypothetical protein|uniref:hypothetical protein n=1 Tax=Alteromonas macleodii TaxID=28108 RepID=UPI0024A868C0|nr:hypothetical protein [Alteromonas macleodii]|tara:strand:- start:10132 stop:10392 length:261 start_codon:yes stop_codon:yes gene_type:complete
MCKELHLLKGVSFLEKENMMLCIDQFGNELALAKEGEPDYADWGAYNFIDVKGTTEVTTPLNFVWKIEELPSNYSGELSVGMQNFY